MNNFGIWLKERIEEGIESQAEFSARAKINYWTMRNWMDDEKFPRLRGLSIQKLAIGLKKTAAEIRAKLEELRPRSFGDQLTPGTPIGEDGTLVDHNPIGGSMIKFMDIPTFDRDLAAGPWTEAVPVDPADLTPGQIKQGIFRVRIGGDSMEDDYPNGSLVEFRILAQGSSGLRIGSDYYIQRDDGMATFKTVAKISSKFIGLSAINSRKYPKPMKVDPSQIVRVAEVEYILSKPRGKNGHNLKP